MTKLALTAALLVAVCTAADAANYRHDSRRCGVSGFVVSSQWNNLPCWAAEMWSNQGVGGDAN